MFFTALIILVLFLIIYSALSGAVLYHLRQYIVPNATAPQRVIKIFLFLSGLFFLFSVYFLFHIPR